MAWEYMEELDYRYEDASNLISPLSGEVVLDFNSGNSRFKDYLKGSFTYKCNDLYDKRADYQITDAEFLEQEPKCDVLCCFGIGGYEITGEKLESSTITSTLKSAINKYSPRIIILDSVTKFIPIKKELLDMLINYEVLNLSYMKGKEWVMNREMSICIKK
jgi:hypothetical protein